MATPLRRGPDVEALVKLRDGTVKEEDLSKRRFAVFCPESAGEQVAEMVLVASNTSPFRQMDQDKPIRVAGTNLGCSRYVGHGVRSGDHHTQSTNTKETWNATGLVFQRRKIDPDDLEPESSTWSAARSSGASGRQPGLHLLRPAR